MTPWRAPLLIAALMIFPQVSIAADPHPSDLNLLRADPSDFSLPTQTWLPHTLPAVEDLFKNPLSITEKSSSWLTKISSGASPSALFKIGFDILSDETSTHVTPPAPKLSIQFPSGFPRSLKDPITKILKAIAQADPYLKKAVKSLTVDE